MDVNHDDVLDDYDAVIFDNVMKNLQEPYGQDYYAGDIDSLTIIDSKYLKLQYIQTVNNDDDGFTIKQTGETNILNGVENGTVTQTLRNALPENTVIKKKVKAYSVFEEETITAGQYKIYISDTFSWATSDIEIADFVIE